MKDRPILNSKFELQNSMSISIYAFKSSLNIHTYFVVKLFGISGWYVCIYILVNVLSLQV
jgi:hypothetical protein